jgi:threonine/homoserine/homoserine lactone efflux protein
MIKTNLLLFNFLKVLSVMFLIFIGVKAIVNKEKFNLEKNTIKGNMISLLQGFSIAILNPKIFVWFVAIYSQFMSVNNKLIFNLQLVSIAGIIDTLWYMALTFIVTTAPAQYFFQSKINIIKKIQGYFFLAIGSGLMFELLIKNFF